MPRQPARSGAGPRGHRSSAAACRRRAERPRRAGARSLASGPRPASSTRRSHRPVDRSDQASRGPREAAAGRRRRRGRVRRPSRIRVTRWRARGLRSHSGGRGLRVKRLALGGGDDDGHGALLSVGHRGAAVMPPIASPATTVPRASKASTSVPAPGCLCTAGALSICCPTVALRTAQSESESASIATNPRISPPFEALVPKKCPMDGASPWRVKRRSRRRAGTSRSGARRIRTADLLGAIRGVAYLSCGRKMIIFRCDPSRALLASGARNWPAWSRPRVPRR